MNGFLLDGSISNTEKLDGNISLKSSLAAEISTSDSVEMDGSLQEVEELNGDISGVDKIDGDVALQSSLGAEISTPNYVEHYTDKVRTDTTEGWNSLTGYISEEGIVYVYSDYMQNEKGENIPGFKVGDGLAYLADLPFSDDLMAKHIQNLDIHVTLEEKQFWNNKVRAYHEGNTENIVFTTN